MSADTVARRLDREVLLQALRDAGADVRKPNEIRCPFHDDKNPSAGVYQGEDGSWRFKCHCSTCGFCGDAFDVEARAKGKPVADVLREYGGGHRLAHSSQQSAPAPKVVYATLLALAGRLGAHEQTFTYTDPDSQKPTMAVIRWRDTEGRKKFTQCRPVEGGWITEAPPKPWPLYNRTRVRAAETVFVVEGEKCVHALAGKAVATTNPGGAGKAQHADWSMLAGKTVYLWPDNDPPNDRGVRTGIAHMQDVRKILESLDPAPRIFWIDPDALNLPPKGDAADYIAAGREIADVIEIAQGTGAAADLKALLDDIVAGRRRSVPWPWPALTQHTRALLPETITVLCGEPGSAKSLMLLQAAMAWHDAGLKVAALELEERKRWHLCRALAIRDKAWHFTDDDWIRAHPEEVSAAFSRHARFIDSFGHCIFDAPEVFTMQDAAKWIEDRAIAGCRLIIVDPITSAAATKDRWLEDAKFITSAQKIAEQFECSIILATHPKTGAKGSQRLDDIAGGSAYTRHVQTVMWVKHVKKSVAVSKPMGSVLVNVNRVVSIGKARNSDGAGFQIAFNLGTDVQFAEQGVIVKERRNDESESD